MGREREEPLAIGVKSHSVVLYCQKALETEGQGKESWVTHDILQNLK